MLREIRDEYWFYAPVTFGVLPRQFIGTLPSETTPSVLNVALFRSPASPVTVTNFTNGSTGQRISILGNGNLTVSNNANIKTSTGANKVLAANKVYHFTLFDEVWYEDG